MVMVTVNGEERAVAVATRLSDFLATYGLHEKMVVVERNRAIVARAAYHEVVLEDADELEIVQMMAGG